MSLKKFWHDLKGWQKGGIIGLSWAILLMILHSIDSTSQLGYKVLWYTAFPILTALLTLAFINPPLNSFLAIFMFFMIFVYLSFLGGLFGFLYEKKNKKSFIRILIIFWSIYLILAYLVNSFFFELVIKKIV